MTSIIQLFLSRYIITATNMLMQKQHKIEMKYLILSGFMLRVFNMRDNHKLGFLDASCKASFTANAK